MTRFVAATTAVVLTVLSLNAPAGWDDRSASGALPGAPPGSSRGATASLASSSAPIPTPDASPGTTLEAARRSYATATPFQETLEVTLTLPDGTSRSMRQVYGVARDGTAFFILSGQGNATLTVIAREGRAIAVWSHVTDRYAEVAYAGTLVDAFRSLEAGRANIPVPAPVAAAQGAGQEAFVDALRFAVLEPLSIGGVATRRVGDAEVLDVTLTATNGRAVLSLDPQTSRFHSLTLSLGQGTQQVHGTADFQFAPGPPTDAPNWPDLTGRVAVASLPALEAPNLPVGERLPEIELVDARGAVVRLQDFRGTVVILDFWATWCAPCWKSLEGTAELANWATTTGSRVRVFAVNTLERTQGFDEQKTLALHFLASHGFEVPLLLDVGSHAFTRFHSPGLPSLVIIGPDGRLAGFHSGVIPDMAAAVQQQVQALLE